MSTAPTATPATTTSDSLAAGGPRALTWLRLLLAGPFGALQLTAALVFSATDGLAGIDWLVAAWAVTMAGTGVVVAIRLERLSRRLLRLATALVAAQAAFAIVKLAAYQESAAVPFLALAVIGAALVWQVWRGAPSARAGDVG